MCWRSSVGSAAGGDGFEGLKAYRRDEGKGVMNGWGFLGGQSRRRRWGGKGAAEGVKEREAFGFGGGGWI
jgi:hypothetical protein